MNRYFSSTVLPLAQQRNQRIRNGAFSTSPVFKGTRSNRKLSHFSFLFFQIGISQQKKLSEVESRDWSRRLMVLNFLFALKKKLLNISCSLIRPIFQFDFKNTQRVREKKTFGLTWGPFCGASSFVRPVVILYSLRLQIDTHELTTTYVRIPQFVELTFLVTRSVGLLVREGYGPHDRRVRKV